MKLDLSIVILNYNTKEFLKKALASIEESVRGGYSWEIIVVDNGSTDGSVDFLRRHPAFPKEIPALVSGSKKILKLIQNDTNLGFAKGNNIGLKKTSGRYVLFLNPDTVLEKNTLKTMLDFVEQHRSVGVASPRLVLENSELDDASHRGFPTPWNAFCYFSGLAKLFPKSRIFSGYTMGWWLDEKKAHEVDSVSGAFFLVRRKAGDDVGWWDEDYFWYGDELDFCYRLKEKGWKVMFVPRAKVLHYRGVASGIKAHTKEITTATRDTRLRAARASTEAMEIFYRKHYMDKYPRLVTWLVFLGIGVLGKIRVIRVQ